MKLTPIIIIIAVIILIAVFAQIASDRAGNLNKIKSKKVGDGQYGDADWANDREINGNLRLVPYEPDLWRSRRKTPLYEGIILATCRKGKKLYAFVDDSDNHTMLVSAPGGGKTTAYMYPNLEYIGAVGMSCFITDTKGNAAKDYAPILKNCYGFNTHIIDLRYPLESASYNLLYLVNKYMDSYISTGNISDKARSETYAKVIADTIIHMDGFKNAGQNQFFYVAAEGVIAGITLLVSELCSKPQRHIVTVFKLIRQLLEVDPATIGVKGVAPTIYLTELYALLPEEHISKDLLAATATNEFKTIASVMSTALSQMLRFIDSEVEQILCFDDGFNVDDFLKEKSALFFIVDEKSNTKNFMLNLIVRQTYNELLTAAESYTDIKLPHRVYYHLDEFGTYNGLERPDQMFSAGRSRNLIMCAYLQSLSQLEKNYGRDEAETIKASCQNLLFSYLSPLTHDAEIFSKILGTQTVQAGSVSNRRTSGSTGASQVSFNMIKKPLMTADEINNMRKGQWILKRTGMNPVKTEFPPYKKWGIELPDNEESVRKKGIRTVQYAERSTLMNAIEMKYKPRSPVSDKNKVSNEFV